MYTLETIRKVIHKYVALRKVYDPMDVEDIKLSISDGNRKIGRVMNVSLMPIVTCKNCGECRFFCYDIKACLQYSNVIDARTRNTVIMKKDRNEFFRRIDDKMSRRRANKFFRWHVSGDIVDLDYLARMVENARNHPDFTIWTYTKNYDVVNAYCILYGKESIPENFSIMFSEWKGLEMSNPFGFPVFACRMPDENELEYARKMWKCPGNCDVCKEAGRGCVKGESSYTDLH